MRRHTLWVVAVVLFGSLLSVGAGEKSQQEGGPNGEVIRVAVEVSADEALKSRLKSVMERDLRSLGDVEVVTPTEEIMFTVSVAALEVNVGGVAAALVVTEPSTAIALALEQTAGLTAGAQGANKNIIDILKSQYVSIRYVSVLTAPNAEELAKSVIATVDTEVLSDDRARKRAVMKYLRDHEVKAPQGDTGNAK
jgi:hypothetical protein